MKKSLVLAMAMALGVTASAYAANPFSDVPAGHWAYDSIDKLAAAGVIEGMGDGTYQGDKTMTRYEMAQIVAKAMAKGANVEKLAAEFADELDNLGVRVAALEKKADNVTITGTVRFHYKNNEIKAGGEKDRAHEGNMRSRLYITGKVNEDWSYNSLIQNTQKFCGDDRGKGEETTEFKEAYMTGKIGGVAVTAGRYNPFFADGNVYDLRSDGIELQYGSKYKVTAFMGRGNEGSDKNNSAANKGKYYGGNVATEIGKLGLEAGYMVTKEWADNKIVDEDAKLGQEVYHVSAKYTIGNVKLGATYLHGSYKDDAKKIAKIASEVVEDAKLDKKNGYVFSIDYKGAEASQPGSWGMFAKYHYQPAATYIAHTTDAETFGVDLKYGDVKYGTLNTGFKGYSIGTNYTVAKNMTATFVYYDTKSLAKLDGESAKAKTLWSELMIRF